MRSPPHISFDTLPMLITWPNTPIGRAGSPSSVSSARDSSTTTVIRAARASAAMSPAAVLVQQQPGRVVVVDVQVGQPGRELADGRPHAVEVPAGPVAVEGERNRHRAAAAGRDALQRVRVGGVVEQHPVARRDQRVDDQRHRLLGAVGDQDLLGPGGQARLGVPLRDRRRQRGDADDAEAVAGQVLGQQVQRAAGTRGRPAATPGARRRTGRSARPARSRPARSAGPWSRRRRRRRQGDGAARALPRVQVAGLPQQRVAPRSPWCG